MTVKTNFLAVFFARISKLFCKQKDDSAFDAQRARLKKVQQSQSSVDSVTVESGGTDGKLKVALRPPSGSVPPPQVGSLRDKNSREHEIAKMTGLSVPQNYQGPGGAMSGTTGESDNFKHWLSGQ